MSRTPPRVLGITLLLLAAVFVACLARYRAPAPLGTDAPLDRFSAGRAREVQRGISGSGAPRNLGSLAHAKATVFLLGELSKSNFHTDLQSVTSCSWHGACAAVSNVVAVREGTDPEAGAVLLMAHYDSVPCAPGASDDGGGTSAVVETARAIGAGPQLRRTVVIVLTDGEEAGLLGAEAFARRHPLAKKIRGVVNVDSRGSTGPSAMFETSSGNSWIIGVLAKHTNHPVTSSLFYEIYRRMPNDTDFTSVKNMAHGVNFANIAGVAHYHTPLDSFDNADPGTLQHHGDQALAMVRAMADAGPVLDAPRETDPAVAAKSDAVWFDVMARFIVRWPASASLGLASLALALVIGGAIRLRAWGVGLVASFASLIGALLASIVVALLLGLLKAAPVPWVAYPLPALLALHGACIAAGVAVARVIGRRSTPQQLWAGTWLAWGIIGVVVSIVAPGACFLFVVPTLVAGFFGWLRVDVASAIPIVAASVLWLPIAILVYDGLGLILPVVSCISSTVLVSTMAPLVGSTKPLKRPFVLAVPAAIALLIVVAGVVPKYSVAVPQRVNVVFRQDSPLGDAPPPPARVYVEAAWAYVPWGTAPEPMLRALGDPSRVRSELPTPWSASVPFAEVPRIELAAPAAEVLSSAPSPTGNGRSVRVRLRSMRGATTVAILFAAARQTTVTVDGQIATPQHDAVAFRAVPPDGVEISLTAAGDGPIDATILDTTTGVPDAARHVRDARPSNAIQTQEGDLTIASRRVSL